MEVPQENAQAFREARWVDEAASAPRSAGPLLPAGETRISQASQSSNPELAVGVSLMVS